MKKLAMNLLKTADEKLRNIGRNQPATVVQTQNFTFYKNQPKRENDPHQNQAPHQRSPQQLQQQQREDTAPTGRGHQISSEPAKEDVAGDAMSRQGRRYRNGVRATEEMERPEIKRRSKSEATTRRVRQSMDERENGRKQTFEEGGRARTLQDSSDTDSSGRNVRQGTGCVGFESDSDSDPKRWTKNPLVVRRMKRPSKTKHDESRFSASENGVVSKNRDSWVYLGNEDGSSEAGSQGGGNSSSKDGGSSKKGSNKYQKLEEMRRKRMNLSVTSDEENTPASRISRLRQRALQGGLGHQPRYGSSAQQNDSFQWEGMRQQHQPPNLTSPEPGVRRFPESVSAKEPTPTVAPERPKYGPKFTSVNQPQSSGAMPHIHPKQNLEPAHNATVSVARDSVHTLVAKMAASSETTRGLNQQPLHSQHKQPVTLQNEAQKQPPARPPPLNLSGTRQSFYTIPEPNSSQTTRALHNSSPEVAVRRFTPQARVPSADSVLNPNPKPGVASVNSGQSVTFSSNLRQIQARGSPTPNQELFRSAGATKSPAQFNEVVELRLKSSREDRPQPSQRVPKKTISKSKTFDQSDDSLDELIVSNIQYLDSEIDKAKSKRNTSTQVSRSSSLPDPRRMSNHATSAPTLHDQPSIQVQASTSIQFHVSLPADALHGVGGGLQAPLIHFAPSYTQEHQSELSYENSLSSQPDVVPRKYSYDSHSRKPQQSSDYFDRDDMSKSDTQLNAQVVIPSYFGNNLHPDQAYARGCVSDINLRAETGHSLHCPQMDRGMFSDVEYDIEVSERVKKWETFMKVQDNQQTNEKKNLNLTPIQEHSESDSLMLPSEVRKSVLIRKNGEFGPSYQKDVTYTPPTRPRPFSSDTSLNKSGELGEHKLFSSPSNAHRFLGSVQDPETSSRRGIQSQSVTSLYITPAALRPEKTFMSAGELRKQMLANRQPALPVTCGPVQATYQPNQSQIFEQQNSTQKDAPSVTKGTFSLADPARRSSRYQAELNEISNIKGDTVGNLRRRFDSDSTNVTSEDDQRSVSTASAKLSRQSRESPSHGESLGWSSMFPGHEAKVKESDIWSPNLESTQGVPVSIERVTARTLQTIPFSEDPFWKEIEEMTSFDPSSMGGHLSAPKSGNTSVPEPERSDYQAEVASSHSSTLPKQPRNNVVSISERMQRSKSLYTPNITPLTINISEKTSSSAVSALDEVLEDINRSSMERKQLSPKKKTSETDGAVSSGAVHVPSYLRAKQDELKHGLKFQNGQLTFTKPGDDPNWQSVKQDETSRPVHGNSEKVTFQTKQPLQFYQQQQQQQQQRQQQSHNRQSEVFPGGVTGYHLDPNLLKQKLLSTGLVVETDTEEPVCLKQTRSSSLGAEVPTNITYATRSTASSQPRVGAQSDESTKLTSSHASTRPSVANVSHATRSSALEDIQKALSPFQSTSYQPGPETLYGTSRFQSFNEPKFDTSRGSNTKATSWTYQPQLKENNRRASTSETSSSNSLTRLQRVNASMDELKDLAQNVERKINEIKGKLQTADEKSLDSILASLRKLTPEVKSEEAESGNFEDYYASKKSKLSDALAELDRICKGLELNGDDITAARERARHKPYRPSKSSELIIPPLSSSPSQRAAQTRVSSVFIPGLEIKSKTDLDKETESEFDVISRSFQAIVDEVNQTTDLFSRAVEDEKQGNLAPETQKMAARIVLRSGDPAKAVATPDTGDVTATRAPKPQEVKPKANRFRSKLQESSVAEDDSIFKKGRSKSVPGLDYNTTELLGCSAEGSAGSGHVLKSEEPTQAAEAATTTSSSSPGARQRARVRPVKDNKIMQDDRATKKQGAISVPSPQPSPKVSRKIVYNSGFDPEVTSPVSPDAPGEEKASVQQQTSVKLQAQILEQRPGESGSKPATIASPASQKKVPPPTAAKPGSRTDVALPASTPPAKAPSTPTLTSKSQRDRSPAAPHVTTSKSVTRESSSGKRNQAPTVSTSTSIKLAPPAHEGSQTKSSGTKQDDPVGGTSGGQRMRRRVGAGVAMILDKLNTEEDGADKLKKRPGTLSAPDLTGAPHNKEVNDGGGAGAGAGGAGGGGESHGSKKPTGSGKPQTKKSGDNKNASSPKVKSPAQRSAEKRVAEGNKSPLSKSTVVTSLERKLIDPDSKTSDSAASSPQPSSPVSKPPQHPWKRQTSDPDKQYSSDAIAESSVASPKFVSKIPRPVAGARTAASSTPDEASATKENGNIHQLPASSRVVLRRVRPPERKIQTDTDKSRPHSFHELISCLQMEPDRIQIHDKLRKYASADQVNSETLVQKVFRSGRPHNAGTGPNLAENKSGALFKFEMKLKS